MGRKNKIEKDSSEKRRLVLIDGHALLFRAYYGIPYLTSPEGKVVNAVYGFTATMLAVIDELAPTHIAVAFDSRGPTFRKQGFEDYKANRTVPPDELIEQFDLAREMADALNIPKFELIGFEADDLIGTVSEKAKNMKALETVIVTGDMDALQLVEDDKVLVYKPGMRGKPAMVFGEDEVREKLGLEPEQVIEMKGLAGDASDNIPGIKGIGQKTAAKLLQVFGTIEGIYEALEAGKVDGVVGKAMIAKLESGKEMALKSRELATIIRDVPVEFKLEACQVHGYNKQETVAMFEKLGFASLVKRLPDDEFERSVQEALF